MRKYFYILLVLVGVISVYTVACKNKSTNTGSHSRAELVGTWFLTTGLGGWQVICVANDGDILRGTSYYPHYYTGKIDETFDYPYTVKLMVTTNKYDNNPPYFGGTITFYNETNCDINYTKRYRRSGSSGEWKDINETNSHEKYTNKLIDYHSKVYSKEDMWKFVYYSI